MATTEAVDAPGGGIPRLLRAVSRSSLVAIAVGALAILSGILTYAITARLVSYSPSDSFLLALLFINLGIDLALGALIAWRLTRLWVEYRSGAAGARLHARLVGIFSVIVIVPAILVAIFASVTVNVAFKAWFADPTKKVITNSEDVARRYVHQQGLMILSDAQAIAKSIDDDPGLFNAAHTLNEGLLASKLQDLTKDHNLQATYMISTDGRVLGSTQQRGMPPVAVPKASELAEAARGTIEIDYPKDGVVTALVPMHTLNALLLLARTTDPTVFDVYNRTKMGVARYKDLEASTRRVQLIFAALYGEVSLLVLLAAIWTGLWAANRLVLPLSLLIGAAERVTEGDLKVQVEVGKGDDEIAILGRTFNRMTAQLLAQRNELVEASHLIDARRRFTEAVLAGVSAGVIGLDGDGRITIVNRAAARLLNAAPEELVSKHYSETVPELAGLIRRALQEPIGRAGGEATVKRGGTVRSLSVQVDTEKDDAGYIVTFDDITDLVSAQRTAAWADVARRIAHEIKNPLTPIQLSAERLKRKYGGEVTSDPEVFRQCTDTIIRQVGDIGRMVDEFSSFARMPTPTMRRENAQELLHQSVFLQRVAHPQIAFETKAPVEPLYFECDGRLVSQALTNVLKNATEAIGAREASGYDGQGRIAISLEEKNERLVYRIADNGVGLPAQHRHRLTEPYVTTRTKGTGLGLAIVKKILEDHGGEVTLADRDDDETGAEVRLSFPMRQKSDRESKTDMRVGVG
ncbi:MAG TPA: PAS domain-containing sensor histidine kinase [Rhizomicrobium sp.]|nr:PAS domain-containing sensor histidine kinase [Rhizomicrobium sp.]